MEEKNSKKNKELLTKKSNDKKLGKKRENGAFAPWSPRPGRRTITLFYTFICEKVWYYSLYTNIVALIWKIIKKCALIGHRTLIMKIKSASPTDDEWYYPIYRMF